MGHQFSRAVAAAAVALAAAACGGGEGSSDPPPVLENARTQVSLVADDTVADDDTAPELSAVDVPDELPPPDPSTYVGANRVVNLWVGPDGATTTIDVWGRRTFSNGPILLASDVGFGDVTDFVGAPPNYELSIVGAGAGPDAPELAGVVKAADGDQITTVFTNADSAGTARSATLWERGSDQAPTPPDGAVGLAYMVDVNLDAFDDQLARSIGADALLVGDGAGVCRIGRLDGQAAVLSRSSAVELDVVPGSVPITLHSSDEPDSCGGASIASATLDVAAGALQVVLVYTVDGESLELLQLPEA